MTQDLFQLVFFFLSVCFGSSATFCTAVSPGCGNFFYDLLKLLNTPIDYFKTIFLCVGIVS